MSGRCLEGVWKVSGGCLEGIWKVSGGGLEAIACIKAIEAGYLHPTVNLKDCEESIDIDTCSNGKVKLDVTGAMSNSFGFGGHNSVCIFGPYKE